MNPERSPVSGVPQLQTASTVAAPSSMVQGMLLAAVLLGVYGGLALSVNVPDAAGGFKGDEATYYMMGHSLAVDGDLTYRREDLVRVWREFTSGPSGVFLKKGRRVTGAGLMLRPPFFWTSTVPDSDPSRLFYGKSFIYPLFAAPFVRIFGTNGFLFLNALLLGLASWCSYLFLSARMPAGVAALLAAAFVMVSVVPVYFVWMAPELFNFALALVAYFCWLYKEVAPASHVARGTRWLLRPSSDLVAAGLIGLLTFSKVSNALLLPSVVIWQLWRGRPRTAVASIATFGLVAGGLFTVNTAISGEWNYQGGEDRASFYVEFPFQTPSSAFSTGAPKERNEVLTDIIFDRSVFWSNLAHNLKWFFIGRYSGLVAYFFPAVFALLAFSAGLKHRPGWQYLVLAAGLAQMLLFVISQPYTWFGSGGSVGNRYFMGGYGLFLFLVPPISRLSMAIVPWLVGSVFVAKLVLNPFVSSIRPGEYADYGPLRIFPVELTNINDLPINTNAVRVRQWFGDNPGQNDPGFQIYFVDRNAYQKEVDKSFWVKGGSRAEILLKTDRPMKRFVLMLSAGPVPTAVEVTVSGRTQRVQLAAGGVQQMFFTLDRGFPYQGRLIWEASISSSNGFVPIFVEESQDTRYLGVRVKPMMVE
jgi:hypothetical protein